MPNLKPTRPLIALLLLARASPLAAQAPAPSPGRSMASTTPYTYAPTRPRTAAAPIYPWRRYITASVFWVGESASKNNPTPNNKSSWDPKWQANYGGYDTPDRSQRTADCCPKAFTPKRNPFYIALPFNDTLDWKTTKPATRRIVPWFRSTFEREGKSVCENRWVAIQCVGKTCYAQWCDVGPFETDDWAYVFGNAPPKNKHNHGAGIDISPAVRDYLGIPGGLAKVNWRFVELREVPFGPWRKYGENNHFLDIAKHMDKAKREEIERLRKARDEYLRTRRN